MLFRTLGSLAVIRSDGGEVVLRGRKPRRLLQALLLAPNRWFDLRRLVHALWENPPATATANVRTYIWLLRKVLPTRGDGTPRIESAPGSYRILVERHELDLFVFEDRVREGTARLAEGHPLEAVAELEAALELWHGTPFDDASLDETSGMLARLHEMRLAATEELLEARLMLGADRDVAAEARALLAEHPFRERLWAQLMLALYRTDRQAEALHAYDDARRLLDAELAVRPGHTLEGLYLAILRGEPFPSGTGTRAIDPTTATAASDAVHPEQPVNQRPPRLANALAAQHNDGMDDGPGDLRRRPLVSVEDAVGVAERVGPPPALSRRRTYVPRDQALDAFATAPVVSSAAVGSLLADPPASRPAAAHPSPGDSDPGDADTPESSS